MIRTTLILVLMLLAAAPMGAQTGSQTVRIKDIVEYKGAGANLLTGKGLVVGLAGTGDKNNIEAAMAAKAYAQAKMDNKGLEKLRDSDFLSENICFVTLQAEITERHTTAGARFRVTAAISDKATSLTGGVLVMSELTFGHRDDDTRGVIAIAGGLLHTGAASSGAGGGRVAEATKATVEATLMQDLPEITFFETTTDLEGVESKTMTLILRAPDAQTAQSIATAVNDSAPRLGTSRVARGQMAKATGIDRVVVTIPKDYHGREVEFRHLIERESVNPDIVAVVTINVTNQSVAISGNVRVLPCLVMVGGVTVSATPQGDLPAKPAAGAEVKDPSVPVNQPATALLDLFTVFDALGMTAADKIKAIESMHSQGSLQGRLVYDH